MISFRIFDDRNRSSPRDRRDSLATHNAGKKKCARKSDRARIRHTRLYMPYRQTGAHLYRLSRIDRHIMVRVRTRSN